MRHCFAGLMILAALALEPVRLDGQSNATTQAIDALYPELAALYQDLHQPADEGSEL